MARQTFLSTRGRRDDPIQLALPCVLSDGEPLSCVDRDSGGEPLARHAPSERRVGV